MRDLSIPPCWRRSTIGDVADVVAGGTPKAGDQDNFAESGTAIPWLTPADLSGYKHKYIAHGARDLSEKGYSSSSAKLMPAGTLLFSSRAPIGYVAVAKNPISTNQGFKNFVFAGGLDSSYAYYFLRSIRGVAESLGTGTTFKEISGATAKTLPFVIAPLAEQQQIAARLDTLLAQVDTLKARLDAIPAILKRFRQSVLAAAVSGRLTENWRLKNTQDEVSDEQSDFKTARADRLSREIKLGNIETKRLKKKIDQHLFNIPDGYKIPTSWQWTSFMDSMERVVDCHNKTAPYVENGIFLIRTPDIRNGRIDLSNTRFVDQATYEYWARRCPPMPGDIIFTREAPMGEAGIVPENTKLCMGQRMMLLRPLPEFVNPKYVLFNIMSLPFQERMGKSAIGTGVKHLRVADVESLTYPLAPIAEQFEIVRRVEKLFAFADQIEQRVKDAQARVNHLTQSILAKAFRGELTAEWREQNPDLISGENSAEALLARIQAERAAAKPAKRGRRKATA